LAADAIATNQLRYVVNNMIADKLSYGPISLRHLEFQDRTFYFGFTTIWMLENFSYCQDFKVNID